MDTPFFAQALEEFKAKHGDCQVSALSISQLSGLLLRAQELKANQAISYSDDYKVEA